MEIIKQKIHGFKCFNKGLKTRFGKKMELNKIYRVEETPIFKSSGFHMCKNMEDTFRYFDCFKEEIDICKVIGYPEYTEYSDEYYGYYEMYSCQGIELVEKLTREQIIKISDEMYDSRFARFISLFPLNNEELLYFIEKYKNNKYILHELKKMYIEQKNIVELIEQKSISYKK